MHVVNLHLVDGHAPGPFGAAAGVSHVRHAAYAGGRVYRTGSSL